MYISLVSTYLQNNFNKGYYWYKKYKISHFGDIWASPISHNIEYAHFHLLLIPLNCIYIHSELISIRPTIICISNPIHITSVINNIILSQNT